jgi:hypothetical protein
MLTSLHLALFPIWEDLRWVCTATYDDGTGADPVSIQHSGTAIAHGADTPAQILRVVVSALEQEIAEAGGERPPA